MARLDTDTIRDDGILALRQVCDILVSRHSSLSAAPGAGWYAAEHDMLQDAIADTPYTLWQGSCAIGASSVNSGPRLGRIWAYARMHGDDSIGHVPVAVAAYHRAMLAPDWDTARRALITPKSAARKIMSFACNVYTGGQPCEHETVCVTADRWMARVMTWGAFNGVPEGARYDAMAEAMRIVAAEYDVYPAVLQAVVWVAVADEDKSLRCATLQDGTWVAI
jgi:hypothetical protein